MKIKVVFVVYNLEAGGYQNYLLRFLKNHSYGNNFSIFCKSGQKGPLTSQFQDLNVSVFAQKVGFFNPIACLKFYKFLKAQKFDTVCDFTGNFGGVTMVIGRIAGVSNRIVFYRRSTNAFGNNPFKLFYNFLVNKLIRWNATKILSNSQFALDSFYGAYWKNDSRFKVIHNGVDANKFHTGLSTSEAKTKLKLNPQTFVIGHVGRFDPAKNHETIFKVASKLKKFENNFTFLFCGQGTDGNEFQSKIQEYEIEGNCLTLGIRDDLPVVYRAMDIMFFPSKTEGQPNALIEAVLSGTPVLPSNIPPILEILPNSVHQNTVEPFNDNEEEIASRIKRIIQGEENRENLIYIEWAKQKFDLEENLEKFKKELSLE